MPAYAKAAGAEDESCALTLSQSVEDAIGRGVGGDADFLLRQGAFDIHRQSAVDVRVQVIHHASRERHIHEPTFAVIAVPGKDHIMTKCFHIKCP